jgi:multidrug efflux pump subunit AcrA (membrane-fusion protein)
MEVLLRSMTLQRSGSSGAGPLSPKRPSLPLSMSAADARLASLQAQLAAAEQQREAAATQLLAALQRADAAAADAARCGALQRQLQDAEVRSPGVVVVECVGWLTGACAARAASAALASCVLDV